MKFFLAYLKTNNDSLQNNWQSLLTSANYSATITMKGGFDMNLISRDSFLDDIFDSLAERKEQTLKCDIYEKNGNYHIEMDAPNIKKENLSIEVDNGNLTILVSKNEEQDVEEKNYIRRERYKGEYKRSFYLGDIKEDAIKAKLKDGSLSIIVPKQEIVETKKAIEIE